MKTLELLRIAEVTEECGKVTPRTIYRWIEDGTFPLTHYAEGTLEERQEIQEGSSGEG